MVADMDSYIDDVELMRTDSYKDLLLMICIRL